MPETHPDLASTSGDESAERTFDPAARLRHLTTGAAPSGIFGRRATAAPEPEQTVPSPAPMPPADTAAPSPVLAPATTTGSIGRLIRLSAGEIWADAPALGSWLVTDPSLLGDAIGVPIGSATAGSVPGHLTAAAVDGSTISVVAEVGRTTDEALGAIVGIASIGGSDAVVWLAGEADPTHIASLSWLNRGADARFFLVRAEGVRIGASEPAALLETVVRPPRASDLDPEATASDHHAGGRRVDDHEEGA